MLDLTKQEKQVIIFLTAAALIGAGILSYKRFRNQRKVEIVSNQKIEKEIAESKIININTAAKNEIMRLRGIGPALAEAIITYRTTQGPFRDKEELKNIKGIGKAKFEEIKEYIKVE